MERTQKTRRRFRAATRTLLRFGRGHLGWFLLGFAGSIGVVACRLAIPWPLRWALEIARGEAGGPGWLPGADPILQVALGYFAVAVALGGCEFVQRLNLRRFTAQLVHDLREACVCAAARAGVRHSSELGDLTARVIGDSARVKSDLSGILIHGSTNGLLFLAVSTVMLVVSTGLGLVFLTSGAVVVLIGAATSTGVASNARKQRKKEGDYASALQLRLGRGGRLDALTRLNDSSGSREMRATRIMARSSLLVHALLGAAVCGGLWISIREIRAGTMAPGEMFLFVAYALTVHRRMVQVGRQAARSGKVVASINRLASLLDGEGPRAEVASAPAGPPLRSELRVEGARVGSRRRGRRRRLKRFDVAVAAGSRVAVMGAVGSGKSSLLRVLAGREPRARGAIFWGDEAVGTAPDGLAARVGYLAESPAFPRRPLWEILGLPAPAPPTPEQVETLRRVGAWQVVGGFDGPWTARVGSLELSANEARALALANLLLTDTSSVWVLDGALEGLWSGKARRCLEEILRCAGERAVVVSMTRPVALQSFDRLLVLRRGRIVYDGPPAGRKAREGASERKVS